MTDGTLLGTYVYRGVVVLPADKGLAIHFPSGQSDTDGGTQTIGHRGRMWVGPVRMCVQMYAWQSVSQMLVGILQKRGVVSRLSVGCAVLP